MASGQEFEIVFGPLVRGHLDAIERKYRMLIFQTIKTQLAHIPLVEARNRKPLLREVDFGANWELRFGPDNRFRVFYAVNLESQVVSILAIGVKRGSRLFLGGEEIWI